MQLAIDDKSTHPILRARQQVSGYQLIKRIGRGGVAEVWEAESPAGYRVALKLVHLSTDCAPASSAPWRSPEASGTGLSW